MIKNMLMAAGVAVAMCAAAQASGSALEELKGSVKSGAGNEAPVSGPAAPESRRGSGVYTNGKGCTVEIERRGNGSVLYVRDGVRQATLGILDGFKGGDIFSFCSPASVSQSGAVVSLACGEQHNGGYPTRGQAVVEMYDGVTAVRVRGEVKKGLGWKTDTDIVCEGLKPAREGGFRSSSGAAAVAESAGPASVSDKAAIGGSSEFYGNGYSRWQADSQGKARGELAAYTAALETAGITVLRSEVYEFEGYLMARVGYQGKQVLFRSNGTALTVTGAKARMNEEAADLRARGAVILKLEAYRGSDEWSSGGAYAIEYLLK